MHDTKKVFCIGFHKTGTSTLGKALERLGYIVEGPTGLNLQGLPDGLFDMVMNAARTADAFIDNPWPLFYKELDREFPGSKFILTTRDEDQWIMSVKNHFGGKSTPMRKWIYGMGDPDGNEQTYIHRFRAHNSNALQYFSNRTEDFLHLDITRNPAWEPLCAFLGVDAPLEPFPFENQRQNLATTPPVPSTIPRLSFSFVCQAGAIEAGSILLAASLRMNFGQGAELLAIVPENENVWGKPDDKTFAILENLNVKCLRFSNPFGLDYPHGNKFGGLVSQTQSPIRVFLDSDILCLNAFSPDELDHPLCARVAGAMPVLETTPDFWEQVYEFCGLPVPEARATLVRSQQKVPPYFNAGVVATNAGDRLGHEWLRQSQTIDTGLDIPRKRPNLDQFALPVAAAKLGFSPKYLELKWNSLPRPTDQTLEHTFLWHYHRFSNVQESSFGRGFLERIFSSFPDIRDWVDKLMADSDNPVKRVSR